MAQVARIAEILVAGGLAAAVIITFAIAVIAIAHAWHTAGRQH